MSFEPLLFWAVILFTSTAALIDYFERRIPNWLTVSTAIAGISFYGLTAGVAGLMFSLVGLATGFGILLVLWLMGGGGGGDVKLMAAVGSLFGAKLTLYVFFLSAVIALLGLAAVTVMTVVRGGLTTLRKSKASKRAIPYALPVAASVWLVMAWQIAVG